jgi:aminoglycoside phosphotransferase (APT) family kinase protein
MGRRRTSPNRRRAIHAMRQAAHRLYGEEARLHGVRHLGEGLFRMAWAATVSLPDGSVFEWVAQVPRPSSTEEQLTRFALEFELLSALREEELPFRKPIPVARIKVDDLPINVTTWCDGVELHLKGTFFLDAVGTATLLGQLAADVHRMSYQGLVFPHSTHDSSYDDALDALEYIRDVDAPFVDDILDWCEDQLPDEDLPAVFQHGDLLPQNVRYLRGAPPALVDWEFAGVGDPATDLAVITRGVRLPFGLKDGTRVLLDSYNAHADRPVTLEQLRLQELALVASEVSLFIEDYPHAAEQEIGRLRRLFRMVLATPSS